MSDAVKAAVIGASARVRGRIAGDEDLVVHGRVEGEIDLRGVLRVEAGGVVRAAVRVTAARVRGVVVGDIVASDLVHLAATAQVMGDVRAPRLVIEPGARVAGAVVVEGEAREEGPRHSFGRAEAPRPLRIEPQPLVRDPAPPPPLERPTELPAHPPSSPQPRARPIEPPQTVSVPPPGADPSARRTELPSRADRRTFVATPIDTLIAPHAFSSPPEHVDARPLAADPPPAPRTPPPPAPTSRPVPAAPADTIASWQPVRPPPVPSPREVHPASLTPGEPLPHPSMVVDRASQRPEDSTRRRLMVKLRRRGDG